MSNQRPAGTPRKKNLLNDYRQAHPVTEAPLEGGKYPAQLMWEQANNGKIMLKVNDGVFKEGGGKHKEVELDIYDRGVFFETLLEATKQPDFGTRQVNVARKQFVFAGGGGGGGGGRMSDNPITQVLLTITRQPDGKIVVGYSKGDFKAQFIFKGPRHTTLLMKGPDGARVEDHGTMSRMAVRNWVNFHRPMLDRMENESWEPPKPRGDAPNNNNRNNNTNNGGGGGGSSAGGGDFDNSFDDDF